MTSSSASSGDRAGRHAAPVRRESGPRGSVDASMTIPSDPVRTLENVPVQPTRIDLLELDIDLRLTDLWREAVDVTDWNLEVVAAFIRAAYGKGYCDALTEESPGRSASTTAIGCRIGACPRPASGSRAGRAASVAARFPGVRRG